MLARRLRFLAALGSWRGAACLLILLFGGVLVQGEDWPDFRGANRDGVYAGPRLAWPEAPAETLWRKDVGAGFAGPVVAAGRLILFHRRADAEVVEALDALSGEPVWEYAYPTRYHDDFGFDEGPRAAPIVVGGQVYAFGAEGVLSCLSFATGKPIWTLDAAREFDARKGFFGAASAPLIDGPRLLLNIGGAAGAGVVALDKDTGRLLWKSTDHEASYSSPIVARIAGESRAVFFTREGVLILDPADGRVVFEKHWRSRSRSSVNAASPVAAGDLLFVTASYGTGALALSFDQSPPRELWSGEDGLTAHYATPVLKDGILYGYHGRQEYGQSLRAVEAAIGRVRWEELGFGAGTVTLAGDRLLLLRENGELVAARAAPERFEVLGRMKLLDPVTRAYPALARGVFYARDERRLIAVRLGPQ